MPPEKHQEYLEHTVHNIISRTKEIIKPTNKSCSLDELFFGACRKKEHNDFEIDKSYESPYWALGKFIFDNLEDKNPTIKVEMRKLVGRRGLRRYPRFFDAPDMKKHDISLPTSALHIAAYENHYEMCQLIMSSIENKSPKDGHGSTPLHYAAQMGHLRICKLFIENKLPLNVTNKSSHTPIDKAKLNGFYDVVHLIESSIGNQDEVSKNEELKTNSIRVESFEEPFAIREAKRRKLI